MKKVNDKYEELLWEAAKPRYDEAKEEFMDSWKTPRLIYIVLLFAFVIPGFVWGVLYYTSKYAKEERQKAANNVVFDSLSNITKVAPEIESINVRSVGLSGQRQAETIKLPMTKVQNFLYNFNTPLEQRRTMWQRWIYQPGSTAPQIAQQLAESSILPELTGRRDGAFGLAAKYINSGRLIDRVALITTTAVANAKMTSGYMIQAANARLQVKETYQVKDKKTGGTKIEYKTLTLWSGMVVNTTLKATYPHNFKVISKDFSTTRDRAFPEDKLNKIVYELESTSFTDSFDLLVAKEEPVKLRKQFSINNLSHFVDLAENASSMVMTTSGNGASFAFDSVTQGRNDTLLNVEKPWKFFKNEKYARKMINDEFSVLLSVMRSIGGLVEDGFFKPDTKINKK